MYDLEFTTNFWDFNKKKNLFHLQSWLRKIWDIYNVWFYTLGILSTVQCELYSVTCTLSRVHCTLQTVRCTLSPVHWQLWAVWCPTQLHCYQQCARPQLDGYCSQWGLMDMDRRQWPPKKLMLYQLWIKNNSCVVVVAGNSYFWEYGGHFLFCSVLSCPVLP